MRRLYLIYEIQQPSAMPTACRPFVPLPVSRMQAASLVHGAAAAVVDTGGARCQGEPRTGTGDQERNVTVMRGARALTTLLMCSTVLVPAGCTSAARQPSSGPSGHPLRVDASVAQFRFDEGTSHLRAGVTNDG